MIKLISKFTTSQPGLQTTEMHIFPNISQSKDNQTIKIGQLIEYNKRYIFLQKLCENEVGRLVPDLFLFFQKVQYEVKSSGLQLSFNILR